MAKADKEKKIDKESKYSKVEDSFVETNKPFFKSGSARKILASINRGDNSYLRLNRVETSSFDHSWIDMIEECIPELEKIVLNPRRNITDVGNVVPVELARKTNSESVRHLATHTQYVKEVSDEGDVIPSKILSIGSEDQFNMYENRFIAALIRKLMLFIEKRYEFVVEHALLKNIEEMRVKSRSIIDGSVVEMESKVKIIKPADISGVDEANSFVQRILYIRDHLRFCYSSDFMKHLKTEKDVRNPIIMTNIIRKNPTYHKCYLLWRYIDTYTEAGVSFSVEDEFFELNKKQVKEANIALASAFLSTRPENPSKRSYIKEKTYKPKILRSIDDEEYVYGPYLEGPIEFVRVDEDFRKASEAPNVFYREEDVYDKPHDYVPKKEKITGMLKREEEEFIKDLRLENYSINLLREAKNQLLTRKRRESIIWDKKAISLMKQREVEERAIRSRLAHEDKMRELLLEKEARRKLMEAALAQNLDIEELLAKLEAEQDNLLDEELPDDSYLPGSEYEDTIPLDEAPRLDEIPDAIHDGPIDTFEDEEEENEGPFTPHERIPFIDRIRNADEGLQNAYNELKREALAYGVHSRISFGGEKFNLHKKTYIKMVVAGNHLKLYFALNPKDYIDSPIPVGDASNKKAYREIPLIFKVKSDLSVRRAKQLIEDVMTKDGLIKQELPDLEPLIPTEKHDAQVVDINIPENPVIETPEEKIARERVSFVNRICKADKGLQDAYKELKGEALRYGVRSRISFGGEKFNLHKKTYIKMVVAGNHLKLYFALDPNAYKDTAMPVIDVSNKIAYKDLALAFKVKSDLSIRRAKQLIADVMSKDGLLRSDIEPIFDLPTMLDEVEEEEEIIKEPVVQTPRVETQFTPTPVVEEAEIKVARERIPFEERIARADISLQNAYKELRHEALCYGVHSRISIGGEKFNLHKKTYIKMMVAGSHLKLYFALDPNDYADTAMPIKDASDKVTYKDLPLVFKVKSDLSLRRAKQLIEDVMSKDGLIREEIPFDEEPIREIEEPVIEKIKEPKVVEPKQVSKPVEAPIEHEFERIIRERIPFEERLVRAEPEIQKAYKELRNLALSYGVHSRISIGGEKFNLHKKTYLKMAIVGKSLKLHLALDPNDYADTAMPIKDASDKVTYRDLPLCFKVRSDLSVRRAKQLIEDAMTKDGLIQKEISVEDEMVVEETPVIKPKKQVVRIKRLAPVSKPVEEPVISPAISKIRAPRVPFELRIEKADQDIKDAYSELKAELLAYGVHSRISIGCEKFNLHKKTYVKMVVVGKSLKLYFALDPNNYADTPMPIRDVSNKVSYQEFPLAFKVKSPLSIRRAKSLIKDVMEIDNIKKETDEE